MATSLSLVQSWSRHCFALAVLVICPALLGYGQSSIPPNPTEDSPQLRLAIDGDRGQPIVFQLVNAPHKACFSFLASAMGNQSHRATWQNFEPFGKISISKLGVEKGRQPTKNFLVLNGSTNRVAWPKQLTGRHENQERAAGQAQDSQSEDKSTAGLYLARQSGKAYGESLIITRGFVQGIDAKHLLCGIATSPKVSPMGKPPTSPWEQLWQVSSAEAVPIRLQLDLRGHEPKNFAYLPALSRTVAKQLTQRTAQKAASSMAATFELKGTQSLQLATFQRQGTLIQVNYHVRFGEKKRKLTLIGGYTNNAFTPKHLHFSK